MPSEDDVGSTFQLNAKKFSKIFTSLVIVFLVFLLVSSWHGWTALATVTRIEKKCTGSKQESTCINRAYFNSFDSAIDFHEGLDVKAGDDLYLHGKCTFDAGCEVEVLDVKAHKRQ